MEAEEKKSLGDILQYRPICVGHGYDVHVFSDDPKRTLSLGGIILPGERGLKAHSDGDVVIHALCDALLGSLGLGDIGRWFPDNDKAYLNIDSKILLKRTVEKVVQKGYRIVNADITILCQRPKLAPFFGAMEKCLSPLLNAPVNVKATTTEGMNAEGRGECISAQAVCLVVAKKFFENFFSPEKI